MEVLLPIIRNYCCYAGWALDCPCRQDKETKENLANLVKIGEALFGEISVTLELGFWYVRVHRRRRQQGCTYKGKATLWKPPIKNIICELTPL
ncbi:unnamed protein product [Victoria cruziana]